MITYIRNSLSEDITELKELQTSTADLESLWLVVKKQRARDIIITAVYKPPNGKTKKTFMTLNEKLGKTGRNNADIYIIGDLNINYRNKKSKEYKCLDFFSKSNGLKQIIKNSTRHTKTTSTLIDIILTNDQYISHSGTINSYLSDHQPIYVIKKKFRMKKTTWKFRGRSYLKYDEIRFKENLVEVD